MKYHRLFMGTIFSTGLLLNTPVAAFAVNNSITAKTATTGNAQTIIDPQQAAAGFVEHIRL
jgi:hypothetical protein